MAPVLHRRAHYRQFELATPRHTREVAGSIPNCPTFPRDFAASAGLSSWTSDRPVIKAFEYDKSPHSRGGRCVTSSVRVEQIRAFQGGVAAIRSMPDIKRSSTGNHRLPGGHRWHRPSCLTLNTSRGNQRKPGGPANNCQWAHAVSQHPLKIVA